jgi:F420-dependent oxidoreductase-like protein
VIVGLQLPSFSYPGGPARIGPTLAEVAGAAEAAGFSSLWVMDHFFQLPEASGWGGPDEPMLEAWTTLGFLARATTRVKLGALVGGIHFRHPGLLVKTATTLDVLSGGRSYLGLGAGWYQREALGLGVPWPSRTERFDVLEETLRLAHRMWSGDRAPFDGERLHLAEPISVPVSVTRPHPPIMIGGGGERRTLRLVAQYADACNILVPDPGESRHKLEVLRRHCDDLGRDYSSIEKTSLVEVDLRDGHQDPADVIRALRDQSDEGVEHVIVNMPAVHDLRFLRAFENEIIPAVAEAGARA